MANPDNIFPRCSSFNPFHLIGFGTFEKTQAKRSILPYLTGKAFFVQEPHNLFMGKRKPRVRSSGNIACDRHCFDRRFQDLKRRCEEFEILKGDNTVTEDSRHAISPESSCPIHL